MQNYYQYDPNISKSSNQRSVKILSQTEIYFLTDPCIVYIVYPGHHLVTNFAGGSPSEVGSPFATGASVTTPRLENKKHQGCGDMRVVWKQLLSSGALRHSYNFTGHCCYHAFANGIPACSYSFFLELLLNCLFVCYMSCVICVSCFRLHWYWWSILEQLVSHSVDLGWVKMDKLVLGFALHSQTRWNYYVIADLLLEPTNAKFSKFYFETGVKLNIGRSGSTLCGSFGFGLPIGDSSLCSQQVSFPAKQRMPWLQQILILNLGIRLLHRNQGCCVALLLAHYHPKSEICLKMCPLYENIFQRNPFAM